MTIDTGADAPPRALKRGALLHGGAGIVGWRLATLAIATIMVLPILTILGLAVMPVLTGADSIWPHLLATVLPRAVLDTLLLMLGVGAGTLIVGTGTAWLVTLYRFPGRETADRLLVIPLAMPTYILAFCYVELLEFSGPVQSALRALTGWKTVRDYPFPDVRTLSGAILVLTAALYPYVYLSARATFMQQSACVLEVARTLGRSPLGAFWSVALPLARPALAAGVALALMECLNDLGAVQHLGVSTVTVAIYTTWLQRASLSGAAQLAATALLFLAALLLLERLARGGARYHPTTGRMRPIPFAELNGWRAWLALGVCLMPFLLGFAAPAAILLRHAVLHASDVAGAALWSALLNTVILAGLGAALAVAMALVLAYTRRLDRSGWSAAVTLVAGLGYAIPGTVLAIGVLIPLAAFDNGLDAWMRARVGVSTGLILSGSIFAVVLAYAIRFMMVALGGLEAGLGRISPNLDAAARTLGRTAGQAMWRVHIPLLVPVLGAVGLLVFVDAMKELPATLLMRPFNFETLAVRVYNYAALEQFEQAALPALLIVVAGLVPVLLLHRTVAAGHIGSGSGSGSGRT